MNKNITTRVLKETNYILKKKVTIREVAKRYKVSKSTVHKDLGIRLKTIDKKLFNKVTDIFKEHLKTRHIKGGEVTRIKYTKEKR